MHKDYLYIVCSQVLIHKDEWSAPMQSDKTSPMFDTTWQGSNPGSPSLEAEVLATVPRLYC